MAGRERPSELRPEPLRFRAAIDAKGVACAVPDPSPRLLPINVVLAPLLPQLEGWVLLGPADHISEECLVRLVGLGAERRWRAPTGDFELWRMVTIAVELSDGEERRVALRYGKPRPHPDDRLILKLLRKARQALGVERLGAIYEAQGVGGVTRAEARLADLVKADAAGPKLAVAFRLLWALEEAGAVTSEASVAEIVRAGERAPATRSELLSRLRAHDSARKGAGGREAGDGLKHTREAKRWRAEALPYARARRAEDPRLRTRDLARELQEHFPDGASTDLKHIVALIRDDWEADGDLPWCWPIIS